MTLIVIVAVVAVVLCAAIGWMGYEERKEAERWDDDGR